MSAGEYDIVWAVDQHKQEALGYVKRLSEEELIQRRLAFGLNLTSNCPIPNIDGSIGSSVGHCVYSNFLGSSVLSLGQVTSKRVLKLAPFLMIKEIKEGLVGGNLQPEFYETDEFKKALEQDKKLYDQVAVKNDKEALEKQHNAVIEQQEALRRFLISVCHIIGVKYTAKLSINELEDLYRMAIMMKEHNLPDVKEWMALSCPNAEFQAFKTKDVSEFYDYCAAARGSCVVTNEK